MRLDRRLLPLWPMAFVLLSLLHEHLPADIAERLRAHGLAQVLFANLSPGNWQAGEAGIAALPGREAELPQHRSRAQVRRAHRLQDAPCHGREWAHRMPTRRRCIAPIVLLTFGCTQARIARCHAADQPINTRDMPGYFLNYQQAHDIVAESTWSIWKVQMDLYHCQVMRIWRTKLALLAQSGHIQIAGVPARHEPDEGEVHYEWLLHEIDALGYPATAANTGRGPVHLPASRGFITPQGHPR